MLALFCSTLSRLQELLMIIREQKASQHGELRVLPKFQMWPRYTVIDTGSRILTTFVMLASLALSRKPKSRKRSVRRLRLTTSGVDSKKYRRGIMTVLVIGAGIRVLQRGLE